MNKFLGIENVVDATPILGADGIADGFEVTYVRYVNTKYGKKAQECKKTVYVREYDFNSRKDDGEIRGFGNRTCYLKKNPKDKPNLNKIFAKISAKN